MGTARLPEPGLCPPPSDSRCWQLARASRNCPARPEWPSTLESRPRSGGQARKPRIGRRPSPQVTGRLHTPTVAASCLSFAAPSLPGTANQTLGDVQPHPLSSSSKELTGTFIGTGGCLCTLTASPCAGRSRASLFWGVEPCSGEMWSLAEVLGKPTAKRVKAQRGSLRQPFTERFQGAGHHVKHVTTVNL